MPDPRQQAIHDQLGDQWRCAKTVLESILGTAVPWLDDALEFGPTLSERDAYALYQVMAHMVRDNIIDGQSHWTNSHTPPCDPRHNEIR